MNAEGPAARARASASAGQHPAADVCLIVEGCYPYVPGGVSSWIDWLMRTQPETTFSVVTLWPRPTDQAPRYALPDNVVSFDHLYLQDFGANPRKRLNPPDDIEGFADSLSRLTTVGGTAALRDVIERAARLRATLPLPILYNSPAAWQIVQRSYHREMPYGSFLHYFWAWRALLGGLFAVLDAPLPPARLYHTISTGYAGVLAARARIETGRPALLTEHGIYTNERRIELLMADWVADTIDKGHALDDPRLDLRDMWMRAFEAYARTCYDAATRVVTLFKDNQRLQRVLGAAPDKLGVIANGINLARFADLPRAAADAPPTMALIGRVVAIKDVETFIAAAAILKRRLPRLRALVMGPTDEERAYFEECRALVRDLKLEDTVVFTGQVDIARHMSEVHVAVLTSLSESQPLVVLEAGAAGIPFVATDVGSCREIIEGRPDEEPPLGRGGIVTDLVAPDQIADAVAALMIDHDRRRRYGDALRARVERYYKSEQAVDAYRALYADLCRDAGKGG